LGDGSDLKMREDSLAEKLRTKRTRRGASERIEVRAIVGSSSFRIRGSSFLLGETRATTKACEMEVVASHLSRAKKTRVEGGTPDGSYSSVLMHATPKLQKMGKS
jgi:hypothetical protein